MEAAVAALATEFAPDMMRQQLLDSMVKKSRKTLWPGTDWRDGHLWMTLPLQLPTERTVGRGKTAKTEVYDRFTTILIRDDGLISEYEPTAINQLGYTFPLIYYHERESRWDLDDMHAFLTSASAPSGRDMHAQLRAIYLEHIDYKDEIYYDLLPLYVMASYVFRIFNAIGYLHFNGNAASGKSQNLKLLKAFALNTKFTSNTSLSALFRATAAHPGMLCLDEAESFNSEDGRELRKLLNQGYQRGASVLRSEKLTPDTPYEPVGFPVYGPKALASINQHDYILSSRCLVVPMMSAMRRIPEFNEEDPRWEKVRNNLYRWALTYARDVARASDEWNTTIRHERVPELRNREWQIAQPFIVVAYAIGLNTALEPMIAYFNDYFARNKAAMNDTDRANLIVRSLPSVLRLRQPGYGEDYYSLKDIHDIVLTHFEEDENEFNKSRTISKSLRTSGFSQTKQTQGGLHFRLDPDQIKDAMQRRGIDPFDEDIGWYDRASQPKPMQDQMLNWLDSYKQETND